MEEIWKDIPDYEGLYQISNLGRVKSLERNAITNRYCKKGKIIKEKILKGRLTGKGYYKVALFKKTKRKEFSVHRLVLLAFVGDSNLTVNHKNEIKTDNRLCNLEYMSNEDNIRYSRAKKVFQFNKNNKIINIYNSVKEAKDKTKICHIDGCCRGERKTAGGYIWRYKESDDNGSENL